MGRSTRLELAHDGATIRCVNQLHHDRRVLKDYNVNPWVCKREKQQKREVSFPFSLCFSVFYFAFTLAVVPNAPYVVVPEVFV